MTPKILYQFKEYAGKPFMPSNGTEGMIFYEAFCDNCIFNHPDPDNEKQCDDVLMISMIGEQPKEWIFNSEGYPTCTKWKKWDYGDGYGGWNEPPEPPYEPQDPNQLTIFTVDDIDLTNDPNQIDLLDMIKEAENEQL